MQFMGKFCSHSRPIGWKPRPSILAEAFSLSEARSVVPTLSSRGPIMGTASGLACLPQFIHGVRQLLIGWLDRIGRYLCR
jgi:hypothetical protein